MEKSYERQSPHSSVLSNQLFTHQYFIGKDEIGMEDENNEEDEDEENEEEVLEEYCLLDSFLPRCSDGKVIEITRAQYGRMKAGRCINLVYGQSAMI